MNNEKKIIFLEFWQECIKNGFESATIFLNKSITYGITVPTFLKFETYAGKTAYVCINIQELLKPKHIASFEQGWPDGSTDPNVGNIWFRLWNYVHSASNDLPAVYFGAPKVTFNVVTYQNHCDNQTRRTGYILFDFRKIF
jgi:hypothetical protein